MKQTSSILLGALVAALALCSCTDSDPVIVRVGSTAIRQSDVDKKIASLPDHRRAALEDTTARRVFVREMAEERVVAIFARKKYSKTDPALKELEKKLEGRELCRYAQKENVGLRLGYTSRELAQWFSKNAARLGADSARPFAEVEGRVAEEMALEGADLEAFFEENASRWTRPGRIEVSAIECSDRARADKALRELGKGRPFEEVAKRFSEHATAAQGGYWGWIGDNERHPVLAEYPGTAEFLRTELGRRAGAVSPVYAGGPGMEGRFLILRTNSYEPGRRPVYAEVDRRALRASYLSFRRYSVFHSMTEELTKKAKAEIVPHPGMTAVSDDAVLVSRAGRPWIVGADYTALLKEYGPDRQLPDVDAGTALLLQWKLWEKLGRDQGLDSREEFLAHARARRDDFWARRYVERVLENGYGISDEQVAAQAAAHPSVFADTTGSRLKAALLLWGNREEIELLRLLDPERYGADSATAWSEHLPELLLAARGQMEAGVRARHLDSLARTVGVIWVDTLWGSPSPRSERAAIDRAVALIETHRPAQAAEFAERALLLPLLANSPSGRDSLVYLQARALMDAARPADAVRAFSRYVLLYPKAAERCKALFMEGFLLDNNLKNEAEALKILKQLTAECPDHELADDAAFMVEDIECGRCRTKALAEGAAAQP